MGSQDPNAIAMSPVRSKCKSVLLIVTLGWPHSADPRLCCSSVRKCSLCSQKNLHIFQFSKLELV